MRLRDVARIWPGPEIWHGIAELKGEGGGGRRRDRQCARGRTLETVQAVKAKLAALKASLPADVEILPTYYRSNLIGRVINNMRAKLAEEFVAVTVVCAIFHFHLRRVFVAIVTVPNGILVSSIIMRHHDVNANLMSLDGIAIAVGAMMNVAVVMIENAHKHIEAWNQWHPGSALDGDKQ